MHSPEGRHAELVRRSRAWMSWSSRKDSTLALHRVRATGEVDVVGLVTTVNAAAERVAMHDVRRSLVESQADALDLPLHVVELPWPCPNDIYEELMSAALTAARALDVDTMIFGDRFLEDIRCYREHSFAGSGLTPVFALWHRPTELVAHELVSLAVRAVITCVNLQQAPCELAGRWYDEALLASLPPDVDPCGENGEFHTFLADGPGFARSVDITVGGSVERDGFVFTDVVPVALVDSAGAVGPDLGWSPPAQ